MNLIERALGRGGRRDTYPVLPINNLDDYAGLVTSMAYAGLGYPVNGYGTPWMNGLPQLQTSLGTIKAEDIQDTFGGYVQQAYKTNGVIFACMLARQLAFAAVRFTWQRLNVGKPSELFGTDALSILEEPWRGGTTQDLLNRTLSDADLAGNSFWTERSGELIRLRPDWTYIVAAPRKVAAMVDPATMLPRGQATLGWIRLGVCYWDGGITSDSDPVWIPWDEIAHFAPIPDPTADFRGMSWLTPLIREIQADQLMTRHRIKFFENGASPNFVIKHSEGATPEKVKRFAEMLEDTNAGLANAYKTMHLYPGADATVVGANLQQLEFKVTQGGGETRIAAAARVPPIIVGLSEGLQAATYSNYGQARRAFADGTLHPLWGNVAGSFAPLLRTPKEQFNGRVRLWYDARDVPLLREDEKAAADIEFVKAQTIRQLVDGGYTPESALRAVTSGDFSLLQHTGLFSVQLQAPGSSTPPNQPANDTPADQTGPEQEAPA